VVLLASIDGGWGVSPVTMPIEASCVSTSAHLGATKFNQANGRLKNAEVLRGPAAAVGMLRPAVG